MRLLPYGDSAVLVELDGDPVVFAAAATGLDGVGDVVPAARTVLVVAEAPALLGRVCASLRELLADVRANSGGSGYSEDPAVEVVIDVVYDGPDLADVAAELGFTVDGVVRAHTDGRYTVAFCGFVPGFGYLRGLDTSLHVPRLADPRTRVPTGSVGIAGEFTGVYPRESPGGWRLLGRTDAPLWDLERDPPALLAPGTGVRFRAR